MNYEKGFFETPEFRELLKRYEQAKAMNVFPYFGIEELVDLLSYYLFMDKCDNAEEILTIARQLHPTAPENAKMEIKLMLSKGEPKRALEIFEGIGYKGDDETMILHAEILLALKDFKNAREIALAIINKLEKYNGCILADSVGLGKTFTALAVVKYYENRNKIL